MIVSRRAFLGLLAAASAARIAIPAYPNVHAYVRERRYGEDPAVMRRRLAEVFGWYEDEARAVGTA